MTDFQGKLNVDRLLLRPPNARDGLKVHELVGRCAPLDTNSSYCNLLQCTHFSATCVVAEFEGEPVGFISAYRLPDDASRLFVWQVAVDEKARGLGLASAMIMHLLQGESCDGVRHLETTITEDNRGSWALFERVAAALSAPLEAAVFFDSETHFNGTHDSELLVKIGPLPQTLKN